MTLQALMPYLRAPEGVPELRAYLFSVVRTLGGRTDADLARCIGVTPAAIANWKRRGKVAEDWRPWFITTFMEKVGTFRPHTIDRASLEAMEGFVRAVASQVLSVGAIDTADLLSISATMPATVAFADYLIRAGVSDPQHLSELLISARPYLARGARH